jgi:hypothetical protein
MWFATPVLSFAVEKDLDSYMVLVTANSQEGDICGPMGCAENLSQEQLTAQLGEEAVLTLYRFEKSDASLGHKYEAVTNAFLWKKADEIKSICDSGGYDAIFSANLDTSDNAMDSKGAGKRDLWLKWTDCSSLETWKESIPVAYTGKRWDFRQVMYKYLDVVFPYFID